MPNDYFPSGPFLSRLTDRGEFDRLREDFLLECKSVASARTYHAHLEHFVEWADSKGLNPLDVTAASLEEYAIRVADGYAESTAARRLYVVRSFLRFLSTRDH